MERPAPVLRPQLRRTSEGREGSGVAHRASAQSDLLPGLSPRQSAVSCVSTGCPDGRPRTPREQTDRSRPLRPVRTEGPGASWTITVMPIIKTRRPSVAGRRPLSALPADEDIKPACRPRPAGKAGCWTGFDPTPGSRGQNRGKHVASGRTTNTLAIPKCRSFQTRVAACPRRLRRPTD